MRQNQNSKDELERDTAHFSGSNQVEKDKYHSELKIQNMILDRINAYKKDQNQDKSQ
jgi:hypothetical protein